MSIETEGPSPVEQAVQCAKEHARMGVQWSTAEVEEYISSITATNTQAMLALQAYRYNYRVESDIVSGAQRWYAVKVETTQEVLVLAADEETARREAEAVAENSEPYFQTVGSRLATDEEASEHYVIDPIEEQS